MAYPHLSKEKRADGLERFIYLYRNIVGIVDWAVFAYRGTKHWKKLQNHVKSHKEEIQKLVSTQTKEGAQKSLYVFSQHFLDVRDAVKDVEDFLNDNSEYITS